MNKEKMASFSLSIEELAMALAMINKADTGQLLLKSVYDNLTTEQVDLRMTAASHSLLAHRLCGLTDELKPRLDPLLEQALLTLVIYDKTFQLSIVKDGRPLNANIHVKNGKNFTSHSIQAGVVHLLEYGKESLLGDYFLDILEDYGDEVNIKIPSNAKISMKVLSMAAKIAEGKGEPVDSLTLAFDHLELTEALAEDMKNQVSRVTLIRINAKSGLNNEELLNSDKQALLLLKGRKRTWYFEFPSPGDEAIADIKLVSKKEFHEKFMKFIS